MHSKAEPVQDQGSQLYAYSIAFVAAVGGFLFGYDLYVISPAVIFLTDVFDLTPVQIGFAMNSAVVGCLVGPVAAGWLSDAIGRKHSLIIASILFGVSAIGSALFRTLPEFYSFRFLGGVGIGIASVVSPMYIAEIAPARNRGALVTMNQLAITVGGLSSVIVCYLLSFSASWRWMFASELAPIVFFLFALFFIPRSPRWLMEKGRAQAAMDVLTRIQGRAKAHVEIDRIRDSLTLVGGSMRDLFRSAFRMPLLIAAGLAFFAMWTGASPVQTFAPIIFQKAGFLSASDAIYQTLFVSIVNTSGTVFALLLFDRWGRRPFLIFGVAGITLTQFMIGSSFYLEEAGGFLVFSLLLNVVAYCVSLAPLTWLIMSEVFPTRLRGKAVSICAMSVWLNMIITNQFFPMVTDSFENHYGHPGGAFWIFGLISIGALLFGWKLVPETKGKSLEEISDFWRGKSSTSLEKRNL